MDAIDEMFDFRLPECKEENILDDSKFNFKLDPRFTAEWYYEHFPGFPVWYYPLLAELSGCEVANRNEIRRLIKKERKRIKKINKRMKKIQNKLLENDKKTNHDTS